MSIFSSHEVTRYAIEVAAKNGNSIAKAILENPLMRTKTTGFLYCPEEKVFTAYRGNNPAECWDPKKRATLTPGKFINGFQDARICGASNAELDEFLGMIGSPISISLEVGKTFQDFYFAYNGENYTNVYKETETTLHNSCMQYARKSERVASFYSRHAHANIIIAYDCTGQVVGRAIVWPDAEVYDALDKSWNPAPLLDRIYYSHSWLIPVIQRKAAELGVIYAKETQRPGSPIMELAMRWEEASINMRSKLHDMDQTVWYPYLDTFNAVKVLNESPYLGNQILSSQAGNLGLTVGVAYSLNGFLDAVPHGHVCSVCGAPAVIAQNVTVKFRDEDLDELRNDTTGNGIYFCRNCHNDWKENQDLTLSDIRALPVKTPEERLSRRLLANAGIRYQGVPASSF